MLKHLSYSSKCNIFVSIYILEKRHPSKSPNSDPIEKIKPAIYSQTPIYSLHKTLSLSLEVVVIVNHLLTSPSYYSNCRTLNTTSRSMVTSRDLVFSHVISLTAPTVIYSNSCPNKTRNSRFSRPLKTAPPAVRLINLRGGDEWGRQKTSTLSW